MYADVIVDITNTNVDKVFEYYFSSDTVFLGSRVIVPFGSKYIEGIVIRIKDKSEYDLGRIKPISRVIEDVPALTLEIVSLMAFMREKYYITRASALRLFLPSEMRKGKVKEKLKKYINLCENVDFDTVLSGIRRSAKNQIELLKYIFKAKKEQQSILNERFSSTAVKSLIDKNVVFVTEEKEFRSPYKDLSIIDKNVALTDKQQQAVKSVLSTDKIVSLLYGVTGSGKTEVYLNLINKVLQGGKTAIMLVPEIALTPQMLKQLRGRFGDLAAILHSGLSAGERFDEWWRIRNGEAKIVIGARSAIFAPLENVGLIIIDEEHDGSYTSETNPRYNTIDIAVFRAKYNNAKIVIGSATPQVESFMRAENGEYNLITLPERINKKPLPMVEIADMRKEVRRGNSSPFSSILKTEIEDCLKSGNQAIIFLNQRGYSKTVICAECGHVQKCEACDVSLTYHMEEDALLCHYCGAKYKMIDACTECGSTFLRYGGVGTERVVAELKKLFPTAKVSRMDRDTTQTKEGHFKILTEFAERKSDILVGTQMIAKGHDFPFVTLVGILDADMSLHFSDYRSSERTFQLLTQVAGRSGRADKTGKVVLQTYSPENSVLNLAIRYDYESFYKQEISIRKATSFPPFTDIVRVLIKSEKEDSALNCTKSIYNEISEIYKINKERFKFFGCMKAPLKRLQNQYRFQILMRIDCNNKNILDDIYYSTVKYNTNSVSASFEMNPNNLT